MSEKRGQLCRRARSPPPPWKRDWRNDDDASKRDDHSSSPAPKQSPSDEPHPRLSTSSFSFPAQSSPRTDIYKTYAMSTEAATGDKRKADEQTVTATEDDAKKSVLCCGSPAFLGPHC